MSLIKVNINGKNIMVEKGTSILDAAKELNIKIPTLCHLNLHSFKMVNQVASCRVCMVEADGKLVPACATPVYDGIVIKTDTLKAIKYRRAVVELILSNHPQDCLLCEKNLDCELQSLAADLGIRHIRFQGEKTNFGVDHSSKSIVKDLDKCILCRRCETMCSEVQTVNVLSGVDRGFHTVVAPFFNSPLHETVCTFCGQCVSVCPTGALTEVNNISKVWRALNTEGKTVVVQVAPAVRVALGEEFGMEPGTVVTGKIVSALRKLGFDRVFDTDFAADLTIIEEASEFIHRVKHGGRLPMLTSCCPAWVKFFEHQFPDLIDIPSTCKSPHQMLGAVAKSYFAQKMEIKPEDVTVVSIMPCVAKKYEISRPELENEEGIKDVDIVITTRELARMIKEAGIDFENLEDENFDNPLGESTGASVIFGVTGGVLEAAVRTAFEFYTGESLDKVEFHDLRGFQGIKEAKIQMGDIELNVAVASSLGNARTILENIQQGKCQYHLIEIMACPGGCIDGGGQPYHKGDLDIIKKRAEGIYKEDRGKTLRKSNQNPYIKKLYDEFIGEPHGEKAHELLHTSYFKRNKI